MKNADASSEQLVLWSPRPNAPERVNIAKNITLISLPAIEINPVVITEVQKQQIIQADACFFVSQHAVTQILAQIPHTQFLDKQIIAIGEKTTQCLVDNGLSVDIVAPAPYTSEALQQQKNFQQLSSKQVAIICGVGGRQVIQCTLAMMGKKVLRIECYQRDMCDLSGQNMIKFISEHSITGVIVTSCQVADAVVAGLRRTESDYCHWPMFAFSQRIGDYLQVLGCKNIIISAQANQQALYKTIMTWWDSR